MDEPLIYSSVSEWVILALVILLSVSSFGFGFYIGFFKGIKKAENKFCDKFLTKSSSAGEKEEEQ